jgi:sterol desaturase/sphingolipid hydroxylase (fatty acid hydroxylase superfamily)
MLLIVIVLLTLVLASFLGHLVHWSLHRPWAGPAYRGHMEHHDSMYPPDDLLSSTYRRVSTPVSGTVITFFAVLAIFLGAFCGLMMELSAPWWTIVGPAILVGLLAFAHDVVHDSFHVKGHSFERFAWFMRMREHHFQHHRDMGSNFGILSFVWDRLLGTFKP